MLIVPVGAFRVKCLVLTSLTFILELLRSMKRHTTQARKVGLLSSLPLTPYVDDFGTALPEKTFKEEKHVETSIFALSPVRFPLPAPITDFDIANGTVCVGLQNGTITKLNLADAANVNSKMGYIKLFP